MTSLRRPCTSTRAVGLVVAFALAAGVNAPHAGADQLRNVKVGERIPSFTLPTLTGGTLDGDALRGKAIVLVFVAAQQQSSEAAARDAHAVIRDLRRDDVALVFATADVARADYFREQRTAAGIHEPFGLDFERKLYGGLGLIVVPTTVVVDPEGRLAHVISSRRAGYPEMLRAYVEHAVGAIDDETLDARLSRERFDPRAPALLVARHRAAARVLRETGLADDAARELQAALAIDADDADTLLDLTSLHVAQGRIDEAAATVARVLAARPQHRRAKLVDGVVKFHQGRLDEAEAALDEALLLNPDPVYAHYYLGRVHEQRGDHEQAATHYREALTRVLEKRPL